MHVRKRNGSTEAVDLNKIVGSISRVCADLGNIDVFKVATKTVGGLVDGVSTRELDLLSIRNAVGLIIEDPIYSKVAARLLSNFILKEIDGQDIQSFSQSIQIGHDQGLINKTVYDLVMANKRKLNAAIKNERDWLFEFHGIQTVYDRYLLKHPTLIISGDDGKKSRAVIETPQYFLMRVACGLCNDATEAVELYNLLSSLEYMASTPTLFNSGTIHSQMSSCFVAGTQVTTSNGIKAIEDVSIGDLVITHLGNTKPVTQLHKNLLGDRKLFDLKCYGTPAFTVTENHRLWSISAEQQKWRSESPSWNRVDYLRTGDWIAIPKKSGGVETETIDLAQFVSMFPNDGNNVTYEYTVDDTKIHIVSHWTRADHLNGNPEGIAMNKENISINRFLTIDDDFAQFLGIWYGDGHIMTRRNTSGTQVHSGIGITAHSESVDLLNFCKDVMLKATGIIASEHKMKNQNCSQIQFSSTFLGNVFNHLFGRHFDGKKMYTNAYNWNEGLFKSFLSGLISSDGCVSKEGSISISMANVPLVKSIYMLGRNCGIPITYTLSTKKATYQQQARINIPPMSDILDRVMKNYVDGRIVSRISKSTLSTSFKEINGVGFVRLNGKTVSEMNPEYVYTLGVEDDHSYPVEGVMVENCYLLDSPLDSLEDIYKRYSDIASLSKFAGGIGVAASRIRSKGRHIKGTNGKSNGLVPWLHTLSGSVAAVNQGGKRKGAACVYLETHHPDIMQFLELRDNTGEKEQRAYNLNLANWVPDLFMKRVNEDGLWSLIDPSVAPELTDLYGEEYEARVLEIEAAGQFVEQIPARKLYGRMMRTLAETGNGWMCFKDTSNRRGNQVGEGGIIHLSNLCTEILEVTSSGKKTNLTRSEMMATTAQDLVDKNIRITGFDIASDTFEAIEGMETAVCNLGSVNIGRGYIKNNKLNVEKLHKNVAIAVKYLDRVIDRNFYPIHEAESSNNRWRPIGLGLMGLADLFFQLRLPFESDEAIKLSATIQEEIYYQALKTSCELAKVNGAHRDFNLTRAAKGDLQFDLAGVTPTDTARWNALKEDISKYGLRNSLLIAIAPTATIAHITGAEECIEPIKSNLLKRETLSGEFISINRYLVEDLKKLDRWNAETINILTRDEGSMQKIEGLPAELYDLYKTVWEISQKKIIEHGSARGAYIDQSQSLNVFLDLNRYPESKRIGVLSSLYMYAWENGLKTTYYFRSRSGSRIQKVTTSALVPTAMAAEEPEICESCT